MVLVFTNNHFKIVAFRLEKRSGSLVGKNKHACLSSLIWLTTALLKVLTL